MNTFKFFLFQAALLCTFASSISAFEMQTYEDYRDGKKYPVIKMNDLSVFAKNLAFEQKGSFCYDDNPANCEMYGRLYTWDDAFKACPMGWNVMAEEDFDALQNDKGAITKFYPMAGGFRNAKGKYELLDKRADIWFQDEADKAKAKYVFYSVKNSSYSKNAFSKNAAMSIRCVNYFEENDCNYECACDNGYDALIAREYENKNLLVCSYVNVTRSGTVNPVCPRSYVVYARYWLKSGSGKMECPETPYSDDIKGLDPVEEKILFNNYQDTDNLVFTSKGLCTYDSEPDDGEMHYKKCLPFGQASKLSPLAKKLLGL